MGDPAMSAMKASRTARFRLEFPKKILGEPVIHRLSRHHDVVPNIVRGKITVKNAWLEVELQGSRKSIDRALQYLGKQGVTVQALES